MSASGQNSIPFELRDLQMGGNIIKPLPETVKSSVRSGMLVFDLTRVVEELIFNSLDAGATKISVAVGVGTGYVKVVDNGSGITRDGLVLLGERYVTSKFDQSEDMDTVTGSFGFHGEALGSISDVSLLEIVTKAHGRPNGYRKVMKGCKCLYLGIDDARQDVGTTVTVRDLFYNQPVRRKQLQSSPRKVLHSLKECILRFALVHLKVSFRIVDIESEDELLCTHPSSSPLPLLVSGFGLEVSNSVQEFSASDGILKLSGYISGPCGTFSRKAFQYVYINSRFVCKGPIHKLLGQLADKFNCLDLSNADTGSHSGKRIRVQNHPSYILNLGCPQSLYDLSFALSKTSVEFKDWDPILSFFEKAITNFWNNSVTAAEDVASHYGIKRKRHGIQFCEPSLDLPPPQTKKMLIDEFKYLSPCKSDRPFSLKSRGAILEFDDHQLETEFACETSNSFELTDGVLFPCREIADQEDYFLENDFTTERRSNERVSHTNMSPRVDANIIHKLKSSGKFNNRFKIDNGVEEMSENNKGKSFLWSCSSRRSLLSDREISTNEEGYEFKFNGFRNEDKWLHHLDMADNSNKIFESWQDERASMWSPLVLTTQRDMFMGQDITERDLVKSFPVYGECLDEDIDLPPDLVARFQKFGSNLPIKPEWSCLTKSRGNEQYIDEDVLEKNFEIDRFDYSAYREEKDCSFGSVSSCKDAGLEIYDIPQGDYCNFDVDNQEFDLFPKCSDTYSDETKWLHLESCGEGRIITGARPSHHMSSSYLDKGKELTAQIKYHEKACQKRPVRSHSAPPHYSAKKKFLLSNMEPGNSEIATTHVFASISSKPRSVNDSLNNSRPDSRMADVNKVQNCEMQTGAPQHHIDMPGHPSDHTSKKSQDSSGSKWQTSCPQTPSGDKANNLSNKSAGILDISSGLLHLAGDSLVPKSISKKCLMGSKVLQQVDKKYIPVVGGRVLAIIDQHAADERIRLEELRHKVLSGEMKATTYLDVEKELVLPEIGHQLLHNYAEQIQNWGWICNINTRSSRSFKKNLNLLNRQPSAVKLLAVPCILGVSLTDADLLEFLQQLADTDGSSAIPPSVLRVLNFKACRGAIMFGDALLPSECSLIVEELKQTSLCFQCAHGRPTTVPLVNLELLHKQIDTLGLKSTVPNELWHGLRRHEATLERAAQRLNSGGGQC